MILIRQPNKWSCTACAFAMACGITLEEFIKRIGHDGSEILFPNLPEPQRRKGFPFPECVQVCLNLNFSATPIDFNPICFNDPDHSYELNQGYFIYDMLREFRGVISGKGIRTYHTVGWDTKRIYDPSLGSYDLESNQFTPEIFWLIK